MQMSAHREQPKWNRESTTSAALMVDSDCVLDINLVGTSIWQLWMQQTYMYVASTTVVLLSNRPI